MIDSKDISFVVQGKNVKDTHDCFKSIRKYFPGATIIFSTYENENIEGLDFDILIQSKDPGAPQMNDSGANQLNRILATSKAGIAAVKTKYCARMRSDLIIRNNNILQDWASKFPKRDKKYSVFKSRICFFQLWTRLGIDIRGSFIPTPFYFSDWFCFGLTEDIKTYYLSTDLVKEPEYTNWFKNSRNIIFNIYDSNDYRRFHPEQYFGMSCFKQFFKEADMKSYQDFTDKKLELSNKILANNLVVLGYKQCGVSINKTMYSNIVKKDQYSEYSAWLRDICTFYKFMCLYKKYCDTDFKINKYRIPQRLSLHIDAFVKPFVEIRHWFGELLSIFYYGCLKIFYLFRREEKNKKSRE